MNTHLPARLARLLAAALAVLLVGVAAGCGGDEADDPEAVPGDASTLTVAVPDDAATFDMLFATTPRSTQAIMNAYDALMTYETQEAENGIQVWDPARPTGLVLESMEQSDDGLTWTIRVREGIEFPSGNPVDAEAIRYMFDRNFNVEGSGGAFMYSFIGLIEGLDSVQVVDDRTVEVRTQQPNPLLPQIFALSNSVPVDASLVEENAGEDGYASEWLSRNTAGSGPYILERWAAGEEIVFRANENYWQGAPALTDVTVRIVPAAANRVALLRRGEVDIAEKLSAEEIQSLEGADGVQIISVPSSNQVQLVMHANEAPFDDVDVRRAISHAVPYDDILESVYHGRARGTAGPVPVDFPGHDVGDYPYGSRDVERARQLLEEAGHADGLTVDLQYDSGNPDHEAIAVLVQNALREIGVTVNIESLTPAVFAERRAERTLTFFLNESVWWVADPSYALGLGYTCEAFFNYGVYCNEEVDQLIAQARGETDESERDRIFGQAQQLIADDAPMVWIAHPNYNLAARHNVAGYTHYNDEMLRFYTLRKE